MREETDSLKCVLLNARSLIKHSIECALVLEELEIKLAFITEAWTDSASGPDLVKATPRASIVIHSIERTKKEEV